MGYTKDEWKAKGTRVIISKKKGFEPTLYNPVFVVAQCSTYCEVDGEEAEANANLIAAAPKMCEALKSQKDYLISIKLVAESLDKITKRVILMHVYSIEELNEKALAKAEGK